MGDLEIFFPDRSALRFTDSGVEEGEIDDMRWVRQDPNGEGRSDHRSDIPLLGLSRG
jgi:hypothetical protein